MIDRIESAFERGQSLLDRIGSKALRPDLSTRLAQQAFLLQRAIDDLIGERAQEAILHLRMNSNSKGLETFTKMQSMYASWASVRNMRLKALHEEAYEEGQDSIQACYHVSGFASHSLLSSEAGIHLWEINSESTAKSEARDRIQIFVSVLEVLATDPSNPVGRRQEIQDSIAKIDTFEIARRYTIAPPLVRDSKTNARTGNLDKLLEGNFDLIGYI